MNNSALAAIFLEHFFATLQDYNLIMKFSNVPESLHSDKICIRFRIDPLSRAFSNQCVFDENAQRINEDGRPIRNEMRARALKGKRISVGARSAMRLNCLVPETLKSSALDSRIFFSQGLDIFCPGTVMCCPSVVGCLYDQQSES